MCILEHTALWLGPNRFTQITWIYESKFIKLGTSLTFSLFFVFLLLACVFLGEVFIPLCTCCSPLLPLIKLINCIMRALVVVAILELFEVQLISQLYFQTATQFFHLSLRYSIQILKFHSFCHHSFTCSHLPTRRWLQVELHQFNSATIFLCLGF